MEANSSIKANDTEQTNSYDAVPYQSQAFAQTHPDRLATIASLFGMKPEPISRCRVLELGCAAGGNIIPLAYTLPNSQFIGIDLSGRQVSDGQKCIEELGLSNIELEQMNIMDVDNTLGTFDYIIVHGIFSWVPEPVQEKILSICEKHLNQNGVAYISYNTYPGWHFRGMIRDMMLYHTKNLTDSQTRAQQARALLDFLSQSVPTENNAYGIMLKNELDLVRQAQDYYFLHDHLEEQNHPDYFCRFAERAGRYGLQYLGESDFNIMVTSNLPPTVDETLKRISNEIVRTEQYMDFLRNRPFRQTLLCRNDVVLNRNLGPQNIRHFYFGSGAKPTKENVEICSNEVQVFEWPGGLSINSSSPLAKAAFEHLYKIFPQTIKFDELVEIARSMLVKFPEKDRGSFEECAQILASDLLMLYAKNMVIVRTEKASFVTELSARPTVSAYARNQAKTQAWVTNQIHQNLNFDQFHRHLIELLDGSRNGPELLEELSKLVKDGKLVVRKEGKVLTEGKPLTDVLSETTIAALNNLAKSALLIA